MNHPFALLLVAFLSLGRLLSAQSSDLRAEMRNYAFKTDNVDDEGRKGISMKFAIRFSQKIEEFSAQRFDLVWRLEDAGGKTIYRSSEQDDFGDQKTYVSARTPWGQNVSYMEDDDVEVAIPYTLIKLPAGPQKLKVVFSLENEYFDLPDFAYRDIAFEQKVYVRHGLAGQSFKVENIRFRYGVEGFAIKEPGMKMSLELIPRYGPDESADERYKMAWLIRDQGKILFDSRKTPSIHHQWEGLYLKNLENGRLKGIEVFLNYSDIRMAGPGEVEVVLLAQAGEQTREIYAGKHYLEVPLKYRFAEQEFSLSRLSTRIGENEGVQGIHLNCTVQLGKTGPRVDPERGDFYVYPIFRDLGGNVVWKPKNMEIPFSSSSTKVIALTGYEEKSSHDLEFFIPWYELNLKPGKATLQFSLFASDKSRNLVFPELSKGGLAVTAPPLRRYKVNLLSLEVKDSNYDTEVVPFGSRLPDLQWSLMIGRDRIYTSPRHKNSLIASPATNTITLAEGDACSIVLYDIDSGFFNADDLLGRWEIGYMEQGQRFVLERRDEGNLKFLKVEVEMV